ncbi:MAG: hypothetical protein AAFO04_18320 [Cyanobacteria bacterium J06592_8]
MTENSEQLPSENIPSESPFGTRNTLLSRSPLGQKFLQPIGARSISVLDLSLFSDQGGELQRFSDGDSPFLVESKPRLKPEATIQAEPISSINFNPSQVTEFNSDQGSNRESDFSQTLINSNPESDIPKSDQPQVRRESASPSKNDSKRKSDDKTPTTKPELSSLKASKSTLFREILGESHPPQAQNKSSSNLHSEQNINRNSFEPETLINQEETDTSHSEDQSNAIASENSLSIQQKSEIYPTEQRTNAIASSISNSGQKNSESFNISENLSQIQRESQTQKIQNSSQKSQGSIQAKPTTNPRKSRDLVPESWSNIEELMGETEKPEPNSNPEQSRLKKPPKSQLLPDSTQVGAKGEVRSSQFENQPTQIKKLMQKTLENRGKLKEQVSARKGHQVQPLNEQDLYALEESVKAQNLAQVQILDESKEEVVTSEHLEELAREIYSAICQRFQVERERYGFNNFSNRLPW